MNPMTRWHAPYLVLQGLGTFVWWAAMWWSDTVRDWFVSDDSGAWETARTIALADIVVFGVGSLFAAYVIVVEPTWRIGALWFVAGGAWYATLVAAMWGGTPVERWVGLAVMVPAALITTRIAWAEAARR